MIARIFRPWVLLVLIFILGIGTGSILTIWLGPRFMQPPRAEEMKKHWMAHLTRSLNLTADQQLKIGPILDNAVPQMQSLHREEMQRGSQIMTTIDQQILPLLTPEQQVKLQKMISERDKEFSGHMRPWAMPGMGMHLHHGFGESENPAAPSPPPSPGQ